MTVINATSVEQALQLMASGSRPVAGGSDLVVAARQGKSPLPMQLVAIDRIAELRGITDVDGGLRIGALTNHATLETDGRVAGHYSALADGSALVGSPSTRNVGTIGGNVMNASPAMDTGAPLIVLNAAVELRSSTAQRTVPIAALWVGPGRTSAASDELCAAVILPAPAASSGSAYVRLEYRRAMEIAVVGAAAAVTLDGSGAITVAAVALTAVAPTIVALPDLAAITGHSPNDAAPIVAELAAAFASPISDLRASDKYRRHTVGVMAARALQAAAERAAGTSIPVPVNRSRGIGAAS